MNQWSRRRKRIILFIVFLFLFVLIGLPVFFLIYRAPTCFDGRQNGGEAGIDCGGACQLLCTTDSLPIILRGDPRILNVEDGVYELVVLAENPNAGGEVKRAGYVFKLYSSSSAIPVKIFEGVTYVPKGENFAIFEGPFSLEGNVTPTRVTFEWINESLVWESDDSLIPGITVGGINLSREDTKPRLEARVENPSLQDVSNIEIIVLMINNRGNIFAASKTFVDKLSPGGSAPIVLTWPSPFVESVLETRFITRILPDRSFIR